VEFDPARWRSKKRPITKHSTLHCEELTIHKYTHSTQEEAAAAVPDSVICTRDRTLIGIPEEFDDFVEGAPLPSERYSNSGVRVYICAEKNLVMDDMRPDGRERKISFRDEVETHEIPSKEYSEYANWVEDGDAFAGNPWQ